MKSVVQYLQPTIVKHELFEFVVQKFLTVSKIFMVFGILGPLIQQIIRCSKFSSPSWHLSGRMIRFRVEKIAFNPSGRPR